MDQENDAPLKGWWRELDDAVLACVAERGEASPDEIGRRLGISEAAAISVLGMLASEGRVRIALVRAVEARRLFA